MNEWQDWIGREESRRDRLDASLAARFLATFDLPLQDHATMPQGIHFCLCTPDTPTRLLGDDGHPHRQGSRIGFLPPLPLPRRMWASSRLTFQRPIAVGDTVERRSRIASIERKVGTMGDLVFIVIDHSVICEGMPAVSERQTLVFREAAAPDAPLSPPLATPSPFDAAGWDVHREIVPDPRLLFRYSALTFNTHRIHYDVTYARDVERYRGLVVHGPLSATLLLQFAGAQFGSNRLAQFAFRGLSPAIAGEAMHLAMRGAGDRLELAAFAADGRQILSAEATLA